MDHTPFGQEPSISFFPRKEGRPADDPALEMLLEQERVTNITLENAGKPQNRETLSPYVSTYVQEYGRGDSPVAKSVLEEQPLVVSSRKHVAGAKKTRGRTRERVIPSPDLEHLARLKSPEDPIPLERLMAPPYQVKAMLNAGRVAPFGGVAEGAQRFSEWPEPQPRSLSPSRSKEARSKTRLDNSLAPLRVGGHVHPEELPSAMGDRHVHSAELPSVMGDSVKENRGRTKRLKERPSVGSEARPGAISAPPEACNAPAHQRPETMLGDAYLPVDLWNNIVARNVDFQPPPHAMGFHFNAMTRPFNRLKKMAYMKQTIQPMVGRVSREPPFESSSSEKSRRHKPGHAALFDEGKAAASSTTRPEAPPSRVEASLLKEALDKMTENIKNEDGKEPRVLARKAAVEGKVESVSVSLEPELYILDIIMSEVVKQEKLTCKERASVLETIRLRFLEAFSTVSLALTRACSDMDHIAEESETVAAECLPLRNQNQDLKRQIEQLELNNTGLQMKIDELQERLETLKRSYEDVANEEQEGYSPKEQHAMKMMKEAHDMRDMLQSKLSVMNAQQRQHDANRDVLMLQVKELEERVRRDAEKLEYLGETVAQYKVRLAWTRVIAFGRRAKRETVDAETQDGAGVPDLGVGISRVPSLHAPTTRPLTSNSAFAKDETLARQQVVTKESMRGQIITFSGFWLGIVQQAEKMDFTMHPHLQMKRQELLELIARTYSEKILADEIDEHSKLNRQTLPEFLYDYYLNLFGEPQLAEEALVIIVANVRTYDTTSARAWMFSRFLAVGGQPLPVEALNIYLASLVRIQNGQVPLLPNYDGLQVDAARSLRVIEYVFMQVPYVQRASIVGACEKLSSGLHIDLDALLLCIVDQWKEESGRAEERLRALFVASDTDGDGNLDFAEFSAIVNHLRGGKGHREMLRMYAEMTLNKQVDCNTFVRVCRKYRFFTFEIGPVSKKVDSNAKEIFDTLEFEWAKFEATAGEMLAILAGTSAANQLEQLVLLFKKKLHERADPEESWHVFRHLIESMTAIVRNRATEFPPFFTGLAMKSSKKV